MNREPVLTAAAIAGVLMAFLGMAVSLGWLRLDEAQMQAIQAFVLPALGLLLPLLAAIWARGKVTPTAKLTSGAAVQTATGESGVIVPIVQAQQMGFASLDDEP